MLHAFLAGVIGLALLFVPLVPVWGEGDLVQYLPNSGIDFFVADGESNLRARFHTLGSGSGFSVFGCRDENDTLVSYGSFVYNLETRQGEGKLPAGDTFSCTVAVQGLTSDYLSVTTCKVAPFFWGGETVDCNSKTTYPAALQPTAVEKIASLFPGECEESVGADPSAEECTYDVADVVTVISVSQFILPLPPPPLQ